MGNFVHLRGIHVCDSRHAMLLAAKLDSENLHKRRQKAA